MTQTPRKQITGFGQHLTLDGYGCPPEKLSDLDQIYEFLEYCPDRIHMTKIMPPYVFKYFGKVPEDWGVSGFVLIAERHISIHTFPDRGYLSLDIFSCKEFDSQEAVAYVTKLFGVARYEMTLLDRGLEFPKNRPGGAVLVRGQRRAMCGGGGG